MRIGLVMDATCDLPRRFIDDHRITVLPVTIRIDPYTFIDVRDADAIDHYWRSGIRGRGHAAGIAPPSVDAIRDLFLGRLVLDYDAVFCLAVASTRSPAFANANQASAAILANCAAIRRAAGNESPFRMDVVDTRSVFAGQGPAAVEAVRMIDAGAEPRDIRGRLSEVAAHTYAYALPRDLRHLRARARTRGDRGVGFMSALVGSALDIKPILQCFQGGTRPVARARGFESAAALLFAHAVASMRRGLLVPAVCVSYGGDPAELERLPGCADLAEACAAAGVTLYRSPMGITGMAELGTGALTLGYVASGADGRF